MKISNNIIIGVDILAYVSFYHSIKDYCVELCNNFKLDINSELIGLCVNSDNMIINTRYYVMFNNNVYLYESISDIKQKSVYWNDMIISSKEIMFEDVRKHKHILDLEYFLKNN
jgi:hypothetical protein